MRVVKLSGAALIAVLALGAVFVSGANAAKSTSVRIGTLGRPIMFGSLNLRMFSSNVILATTAGNLECEESSYEGTLETNESKKDLATITSASFSGDYLGIPGACKTSATGPVTVEASGLPWHEEITNKGETLKGTKKLVLTVTFLVLEGPNNKCTFEASKLSSTYGHNISETTPEENTAVMTKQVFKHNRKAANQSALCPTEGTASGTFNMTNEGEPILLQLV